MSQPGQKPCVFFSSHTTWNLVNFRGGIVRELVARGFDVYFLAPNDDTIQTAGQVGATAIPAPINTGGTNPLEDLRLVAFYRKLLRTHKPIAIMNFNVKPVIYGTMGGWLAGVPAINTITGIGTSLEGSRIRAAIIKALYKFSLNRSRHVFFQNQEHFEMFRDAGLVNPAKVSMVSGSGVNLDHYPVMEMPGDTAPVFLLVARVLTAKGIYEYAEAARAIRKDHPAARFVLIGEHYADRAESVKREDLDQWVNEGIIEYHGRQEVLPWIKQAHCIVLPSYSEGLPRSLLEAASCGRPIVATNISGCREVVVENVNGLFCEPRNGPSLEKTIRQFIALGYSRWLDMAAQSRQIAEKRFDERMVVKQYIDEITRLIDSKKKGLS